MPAAGLPHIVPTMASSFVIRPGKEHITGYMYEPWHIRYVGNATASAIMSSGLTLEEYLGVY